MNSTDVFVLIANLYLIASYFSDKHEVALILSGFLWFVGAVVAHFFLRRVVRKEIEQKQRILDKLMREGDQKQ